jgi:hypothetical protein
MGRATTVSSRYMLSQALLILHRAKGSNKDSGYKKENWYTAASSAKMVQHKLKEFSE